MAILCSGFCTGYVQHAMRPIARMACALGVIMSATTALAAEDAMVPHRETACAFGAWLVADDGADVPVRDVPADDGAVLGTLPVAPRHDSTYEYPIELDLVATRDGWVKIANASDENNVGSGAPIRPIFRGEGWIPSNRARLGLQSGRGYAGPSTNSRRILDFAGRWLTEVATIERILGCDGEWVLLEVAVGPILGPDGQAIPPEQRKTEPRRAWFRGVCSNAITTCDMPDVDRSESK